MRVMKDKFLEEYKKIFDFFREKYVVNIYVTLYNNKVSSEHVAIQSLLFICMFMQKNFIHSALLL